jgi:deoxyribose-phosphate aldolase
VASAPDISARIDYAFWDAAADARSIERACVEALQLGVRAISLASSRLALARTRLDDTPVKVISWVGFPLGTMDNDAKRFETEVASDSGAHEIELVLNMGLLKDGNHKALLREIRDVVEAADERPVCAVLETQWFTPDETALACELILDSGAQSLANTSGYWPEVEPRVEEIQFLRQAVGANFGVKVSGLIQNPASAAALLQAGADRLGLGTANLASILG